MSSTNGRKREELNEPLHEENYAKQSSAKRRKKSRSKLKEKDELDELTTRKLNHERQYKRSEEETNYRNCSERKRRSSSQFKEKSSKKQKKQEDPEASKSSSREENERRNRHDLYRRIEEKRKRDGIKSKEYDKKEKDGFYRPKGKKMRRDETKSRGKYNHDEQLKFAKYEKSMKLVQSLKHEIKSILRTESHHVIRKERVNGDIVNVEWCYYYLDPNIRGHLPGGRAQLHHLCRVCKRTCLHLLGKYGTGNRKCLACAADEKGWKKSDVPPWYFHKNCQHCEKHKNMQIN